MKYMLLVYSKEQPSAAESLEACGQTHTALMDEAARRGVLISAAPLEATAAATTVRRQNGHPLVSDGPFAETKEQLAGYYILDCRDLDEAVEWASRIPTDCFGGEGCIEIRPLRGTAAASQGTEPANASISHG